MGPPEAWKQDSWISGMHRTSLYIDKAKYNFLICRCVICLCFLLALQATCDPCAFKASFDQRTNSNQTRIVQVRSGLLLISYILEFILPAMEVVTSTLVKSFSSALLANERDLELQGTILEHHMLRSISAANFGPSQIREPRLEAPSTLLGDSAQVWLDAQMHTQVLQPEASNNWQHSIAQIPHPHIHDDASLRKRSPTGCPMHAVWQQQRQGEDESTLFSLSLQPETLELQPASPAKLHTVQSSETIASLSNIDTISQFSSESPSAGIKPQPTTPAKLNRRQLRQLNRPFTLSEVRQHKAKDDAWIAVGGSVYDITDHVLHHPGWHDRGQATTVLSIMAHAGSECTEEFTEIHKYIPKAWAQLRAYYIGELALDE